MNLKNTLLNQPIQEKYQESQLEDSGSYPTQQINSDLLISVIIPVYNEENSIKEVIERIPNHLNYEIILVDDGSTDNSLEKVKVINNKYIKVVKHKSNKGYGAAILTGIKSATGDIIVTMDSDGQHCPEEIPNIINPILNKKVDIVVGSRYLGNCHFKIPIYTRLGEFIIRSFIWFFYNQKIYNNQSGFRAYNRRALKIISKTRDKGMGFSTEVLLRAVHNKLRIIEIPITAFPRKYGVSYVNLIKIIKSISFCIFIFLLLKIRINLYKLLKL